MDVYSTEEEQMEAIRKWWRENGKSAVLGVVLGLGAIFGWRAWQTHQIEQAETASDLYQSALVAASQDDRDQARTHAMDIITNYSNTGYAVMARMILASIDSRNSDYPAAGEHLNAALEATDNETLKEEIALRLARVYIADGKLDQALSLLSQPSSDNFSSQYNELKGDVYALQGKSDEARTAYQQAMANAGSSGFNPSMIDLKLNSLD